MCALWLPQTTYRPEFYSAISFALFVLEIPSTGSAFLRSQASLFSLLFFWILQANANGVWPIIPTRVNSVCNSRNEGIQGKLLCTINKNESSRRLKNNLPLTHLISVQSAALYKGLITFLLLSQGQPCSLHSQDSSSQSRKDVLCRGEGFHCVDTQLFY